MPLDASFLIGAAEVVVGSGVCFVGGFVFSMNKTVTKHGSELEALRRDLEKTDDTIEEIERDFRGLSNQITKLATKQDRALTDIQEVRRLLENKQ